MELSNVYKTFWRKINQTEILLCIYEHLELEGIVESYTSPQSSIVFRFCITHSHICYRYLLDILNYTYVLNILLFEFKT